VCGLCFVTDIVWIPLVSKLHDRISLLQAHLPLAIAESANVADLLPIFSRTKTQPFECISLLTGLLPFEGHPPRKLDSTPEVGPSLGVQHFFFCPHRLPPFDHPPEFSQKKDPPFSFFEWSAQGNCPFSDPFSTSDVVPRTPSTVKPPFCCDFMFLRGLPLFAGCQCIPLLEEGIPLILWDLPNFFTPLAFLPHPPTHSIPPNFLRSPPALPLTSLFLSDGLRTTPP